MSWRRSFGERDRRLERGAGLGIGEADGAFAIIANGFLCQASLLRGSQHRTGMMRWIVSARGALLKRA
jgi:hypothetical protein